MNHCCIRPRYLNLKRLVVYCGLLWCFFAAGQAQAQTPLIFTSTKYALPGDVVTLHGANFIQGTTQPEVWIDPISGSTDTPDLEIQATDIISQSDKLIHVRIPSNVATGLYALFVKVGANTSAPVWINRADAWQVLDICGSQINPGRAFRLYGWSLDLTGATPKVWFENTATSVRTAATVTNMDRTNFITLSAPTGIVAGQTYRLIVSNGYGGSYGETVGPTLSCVATPVDALNLGVPWADEFSFAATNVYNVKNPPYNAVGDGVADDRAAIQAACDAASAAGGGGVYLPAGTYNLGATELKPKSRVVLRGAGMNLTTVIGTIVPFYVHSTMGTTFYNGAMDFTLNGNRMRWHSGSPNGGPVIVVRVRIENNTGTGLDVSGGKTKTLVKDCEIITHSTTSKGNFFSVGTQNLLFKNNIVQWSEGRLESNSVFNSQVDSCTFRRTVDTTNSNLGYGGWEVSAADDLAIIDNTFEKIGTGPIPQYNDGETILNQAIPRLGAGAVSSATSNTLTDSTITWTTNELITGQAYAVIVSGPGEGQWRKVVSHTANTATLDTPWDIIPTSASKYSMTGIDQHWLIAGNAFNDCPRALWLYSCTMADVAVVDNDYINCADIYLRADQRLADTPHARFSVFRNVLLQNNEVLNNNHVYPTQLACQAVIGGPATEASIGNAFWDVVIRDNAMDSIRPSLTTGNTYGVNGEGYFAIGTNGIMNGAQGIKGVLFDRNAAYDFDKAFNTSTGAFQTTIWNPDLNNVGAAWTNTVNSGSTLGALQTTVGNEAEKGTLTNANVITDTAASNGQSVSLLNVSTASATVSGISGGNVGGTATLKIRYATVGANPVKNLYVNGTLVGTLTFPATPLWTTYATVTTTVNLTAGSANTIKIASTATDTKGLRLDSVAVVVP